MAHEPTPKPGASKSNPFIEFLNEVLNPTTPRTPEQELFVQAFIEALMQASQGGRIEPNAMSPEEESVVAQNALNTLQARPPPSIPQAQVPGTRDQGINLPSAVRGPQNPFRGR